MGHRYSIIRVTDNKSGSDIVVKTLQNAITDFHLTTAANLQELEKQLNNNSDLILCDYSPANFSYQDVLDAIKNYLPILPVIIYGKTSQKAAIAKAMANGAADFITEYDLERLVPAVKRELRNHRQNVSRKLTNEHALLHQISALDIYNSTIDDLLDKAAACLSENWVNPESIGAIIQFNDTTYTKGSAGGSERRLIETAKTIRADDSLAIQIIFEDRQLKEQGPFNREERNLLEIITASLVHKINYIFQRRELEKKEKLLDKPYHLTQIGYWEMDLLRQKLHWSNEIKRLHGVENDFVPDLKTAITFCKEGEHRYKIQQVIQRAIDSGEPFDVELKIITLNGNERWVRVVGEAEFENSECRRIYGSTQDITTRKEAEEKLKRTEQKLREIVENSTNMFYRHDTNHVLTYLSPQCKDFLGYSVEEAKQQWTEFATDHPINKKGFQYTRKAIETGQTQPAFELQLQKKNGDIIWVLVNEAPIVEDGKTAAIVGSLTDITAQKDYEDKLEQLSLVASKTTDMIMMTDAEENITWVNNAFEEETGYTLAEVRGKNPGELLQGPETNPNTIKRIAKKLDNLETVQEVILNYSKHGRKYWLDMTIDPILDEDGQCTGFIAIEKDVTAEIQRSRKLQESVERFEIVSKATSDTIRELDMNSDTIQYNQNIYAMFGYDKDEVDETKDWWQQKIHPLDQRTVQQKLDDAFASNDDRLQLEYRFKCADGSYKYIYDRTFVVRNSNNDPIRIIGAMQDITTFKEREQRSRQFQEIISSLATNRSLQQMDVPDALCEILSASARALDVQRVNIWMLDNDQLRCICSYDQGRLNTMRDKTLTKEKFPTYFKYIHERRIIAATNANDHKAYKELTNDYLKPNNITSILDTSVLSYGSTQAVVCHEAVGEKREWKNDEISFAGAITDQIAQLMAYQEKKERDLEIRESLKEKETLLAEVHHRVKNNLAVVSGMMQLQAYEEADEDIRNKLFDSVARIQTMAAIHELLYQSNSFSNLRLDENIQKLISNITETFQADAAINLKFDLAPIKLNVNQAIPCSLIVNEVVTNALKHAFDDEGTIRILLREQEKRIKLTISDNGKGLPDDYEDLINKGSLGFKLIDTLSFQLNGHYQFSSGNPGTEFTFQFDRAEIRGIGNAHLE